MPKQSKSAGIIFFWCIACLFAGLTLWVISDVEAGWHACKFDEKYVFTSVHSFYLIKTPEKILRHILFAGPYLFGRITFYVPVLVAAIPTHFLGDAGQIFGTRIAESFILFSAYFLITLTFVKTWHFRALALLAVFTLPYTQYFAVVSKPEMILLFNLLLFLIIFLKKGAQNSWAWLFLGLAYGAKISLLPFVLVIMPIAFFLIYQKFTITKALRVMLLNILVFMSGLALAAPTAFTRPEKYLALFLNKGAYSSYEDKSVDFFEWLHYIFLEYFYSGSFLIGAILLTGLIACSLYCFSILKEKGLTTLFSDRIFILIMTGLSFLLPPMLFISRKLDRGHYLHLGFIFIWIAIFILIEHFGASKSFSTVRKKQIQHCIFGGILLALLPQLWGSVRYSTELALESQSETFLALQRDFIKFDSFVRVLHKKTGQIITVNYDPELLRVHPYKSQSYIHPYYNFSKAHEWVKGYELTYSSTDRSNYPERLKEFPKTMARHQMFADEYAGFKRHVIGQSSTPEPPVYKELNIGLEKARLWMKVSE